MKLKGSKGVQRLFKKGLLRKQKKLNCNEMSQKTLAS